MSLYALEKMLSILAISSISQNLLFGSLFGSSLHHGSTITSISNSFDSDHYLLDSLSPSPSSELASPFSSSPPLKNILLGFDSLLQTSLSNIYSRFPSIANIRDIFPTNTFYRILDSTSSFRDYATPKQYANILSQLSTIVSNHPPVYLKSRSLFVGDIKNRYIQALKSLSLQDNFDFSLESVSSNTFLFALHPKVNSLKSSATSSQSSSRVVSNQDHLVSSSLSSKIHQLAKSAWPADFKSHQAKSLQLYSATESFLNSLSVKSSNPRDLIRYKKSDTSSYSALVPALTNLLQKVLTDSKHDSLINNFLVHNFRPTFNLYEASEPHHLLFLSTIRQHKGDRQPLILNARHLSSLTNLLPDFISNSSNLYFLNPLVIKSSDKSIFMSFLSALGNSHFPYLMHARGSSL